jgi:hypothetical protein
MYVMWYWTKIDRGSNANKVMLGSQRDRDYWKVTVNPLLRSGAELRASSNIPKTTTLDDRRPTTDDHYHHGDPWHSTIDFDYTIRTLFC